MSEDSDAFEEYKTIKVGELATREAVDIRQQIPVVACVCFYGCVRRVYLMSTGVASVYKGEKDGLVDFRFPYSYVSV